MPIRIDIKVGAGRPVHVIDVSIGIVGIAIFQLRERVGVDGALDACADAPAAAPLRPRLVADGVRRTGPPRSR